MFVGVYVVVFFFFQAEDGIRDLVRSRGLGDVYKRQVLDEQRQPSRAAAEPGGHGRGRRLCRKLQHREHPVSYTHLTLPTSDLV